MRAAPSVDADKSHLYDFGTPIFDVYKVFSASGAVLEQYASRVVSVSSFYGTRKTAGVAARTRSASPAAHLLSSAPSGRQCIC